MVDLKEGDSVLTVDTTGELVYSEVILSLHQAPKKRAEFYKIRTDKGHSLTVTANHLLYVLNDPKDKTIRIQTNTISTKFAAKVTKDSFVLVHEEHRLVWEKVVEVTIVQLTGVYSPLTNSGNIVVDDIIASCYSDFERVHLIHLAFAPYRWWRAAKDLILVNNEGEHDTNYFKEPKDVPPNWYGKALTLLAETLFPEYLFESISY